MKPLLALLFLLSAVPAPAQSTGQAADTSSPDAKDAPEAENGASYGFEADFNSRYVWRGIESSAGAVFQPSAWAGWGNWELGAWASMPLERGADRGRFNEADLYLSYTHEGKGFALKPQVQLYTYPGTGAPSTAEASLRASMPWGPVSLYTEQSVDFGELDGAYFGEIGVEYETEPSPRWSRSAGLSFGWANAKFNASYVGPSKCALNVVSGQIAWTHTAKNGVYVRPHLYASALIDRSLRDAVDHPDFIVAGIAVGKEF